MARRRYLVMYDICDEYRLRRVHEIVSGHGDRLQYSVYVCDLNPTELVKLQWQLTDEMNLMQDSVAILNLGETQKVTQAPWKFLGVRPRLPTGGATII